MNTSNPQIGRTTENAEIQNLPIVGRNVYTLLSLTPGVDSNVNSIVLGFPQQVTMINGGVDGGAGSVNYFLDGGTNMTGLRNTGNIAPNPDAVEEFRVITNSYSAEFGRFASGVINILTKSGTNQFHGALFEFLRNTGSQRQHLGQRGLNAAAASQSIRRLSRRSDHSQQNVFLRKLFRAAPDHQQLPDGRHCSRSSRARGELRRAADRQSAGPSHRSECEQGPFPNNQIPLTRMDPDGAEYSE